MKVGILSDGTGHLNFWNRLLLRQEVTRSFCMIQELLERFWGLAGDFLQGGRKKQLTGQVKRWVRDEEDLVVFSYILGVLLLLCCVCLVWTLSNISALRALISQGVIFIFTRHMKFQSARSHIYDEAISGLEPTHWTATRKHYATALITWSKCGQNYMKGSMF